nr:hypothetical protein [uncultured Actinotalea sp.]
MRQADGADGAEAGLGGVTGLGAEAGELGVGGVVGEAGDIGVSTLVAETDVVLEPAETEAGLTAWPGVVVGATELVLSSDCSGAGVGCWATGPAANAAAAPTPRAPRAPVTTATVRLFMMVSFSSGPPRGPVLLC